MAPSALESESYRVSVWWSDNNHHVWSCDNNPMSRSVAFQLSDKADDNQPRADQLFSGCWPICTVYIMVTKILSEMIQIHLHNNLHIQNRASLACLYCPNVGSSILLRFPVGPTSTQPHTFLKQKLTINTPNIWCKSWLMMTANSIHMNNHLIHYIIVHFSPLIIIISNWIKVRDFRWKPLHYRV